MRSFIRLKQRSTVRLAAARGADERGDLVLVDREVDVADRPERAVVDAEVPRRRTPRVGRRRARRARRSGVDVERGRPRRRRSTVGVMSSGPRRRSPLLLVAVAEQDGDGVDHSTNQQHDDGGRGRARPNSSSGSLGPRGRSTIGRAVKPPGEVAERQPPVKKPGRWRPIRISGAASPSARASDSTVPVRMPGSGVGQHVAADDLPAGGADAEAGLAEAVGHGPDRLGRGDDHDRAARGSASVMPAAMTRRAAGDARRAPSRRSRSRGSRRRPTGTPARLRMFTSMKRVSRLLAAYSSR